MLYPLSYGGGDRLAAYPSRRRTGVSGGRPGVPTRMSTSKKAKHTVDRLTGRVKENLGEITGNDRLRSEGRVDQLKARVKMSGERFKDAVRGR